MGSPRRNRSKFEKPKDRWNIDRIKSDGAIIEQYGLKNMKELWKVQTELSRIRGNVRALLSGVSNEEVMNRIVGRLARLGISNPNATLEDLLDLKENSVLERRLQTIVFRKGLARSIKQARQLTVHGFIMINGKRVNRPGYIVDSQTEKLIGYYKPIDIAPKKKESKPEVEQEAEKAQAAAAEPAEAPEAEKAES
jgi:small subunit ribosomal protein S4